MAWEFSDLPGYNLEINPMVGVTENPAGRVESVVDQAGNYTVDQTTSGDRLFIGTRTLNGHPLFESQASEFLQWQPFSGVFTTFRLYYTCLVIPDTIGTRQEVFTINEGAATPGRDWDLIINSSGRPEIDTKGGGEWVGDMVLTAGTPYIITFIGDTFTSGSNNIAQTSRIIVNGIELAEFSSTSKSQNINSSSTNFFGGKGSAFVGALGPGVLVNGASLTEREIRLFQGKMAWIYDAPYILDDDHIYRFDGTPFDKTWEPATEESYRVGLFKGVGQTSAGGKLQSWNDYSSNGESAVTRAVDNDADIQPDGSVTFDGSDQALAFGSRFGIAAPDPSLMVVTLMTPISNANVPGIDGVWQLGDGNSPGTIYGTIGSGGYSWRHQNGNNIFDAVTFDRSLRTWLRTAGDTYSQERLRSFGQAVTSTSSSNGTLSDTQNEYLIGVGALTLYANFTLEAHFVLESDSPQLAEAVEAWIAWRAFSIDGNRGVLESLPAGNPFRLDGTAFGFGRAWAPSDIRCGGSAYWFSSRKQFSDFIIASGASVSEWKDIRGSAVTFEQSTASLQPQLDEVTLEVQVIRGNSDLMIANQLSEDVEQDLSIIGYIDRGTINDAFSEVTDSPSTVRMLDGGRFVATYGTVDGPGPSITGPDTTRNTWERSTGKVERFIDGSLTPNRSFTPGTPPSNSGTWTELWAFDDSTGGNALTGYLVDVIYIFGESDLDCLQLSEAYVAWAAGDESSLSSDNPYDVGLPLNPAVINIVTQSFRSIEFDGSDSVTDGSATYEWDFGDGSDPVFGVNPTHFYDVIGTYTVTLTVTDSWGTRSTTQEVTPTNEAPVAAFSGSIEGNELEVDASASTDDMGIVSYEWDWGDGSPNTFGVTQSHIYASANTLYTVTLTVTDTDGATDSTAQNFTTDVLPTADIDIVSESFRTVSVSGAGSSGTNISYAWDWGDGQTSTGETATHTYSSTGVFTITLTITADEGSDTDSISFTATEQGNSPRTEVVGFDVPSNILSSAGNTLQGWASLATIMNQWLGTEQASRIWIRDFQVDIAHGSSHGNNGLQAYILYENAWRPFEETRIGVTYEAKFFNGPLPDPFTTWEEWFASEVDSERNKFLPQFIVPIPPVDGDSLDQDTRYFIVGISITPNDIFAHQKDTSCLIGIPIEPIPTNDFGVTDLYDSSGKFTRQTASVINVGPVTIEAGEIILCIPDQEDSDYIAISMCCRPP